MPQDPKQQADHRRLGRELELFHFSPVAPGQAFWQPRGVRVWNELLAWWREEQLPRGYEEVRSPLVCDAALWRQSGHWDKFAEAMYRFRSEDHELGLKPMNCPGHVQLFLLRPRSYRELPLRLCEAGQLHRLEPSGSLNGLLRARGFVQDDAHVFCEPAQAAAEVALCLDLVEHVYRLFGFEPRYELSLRPARRLGDDALWDRCEGALRDALVDRGLRFREMAGEGAFYGPKIDLFLVDSLDRSWQMGSIQLDEVLPERFDLRYAAADGSRPRPAMVHRAILGSFERFLAILLEHCDGDLPLWLAPQHAVVLPVAARHGDYAEGVAAELAAAGLRADVDAGGPLGGRVRDAERRRVPFQLVCGDRDRAAGEVSVRRRRRGELGPMPVAALAAVIREEVGRRLVAPLAA